MLGLVELLLGIFVVSQMSQLGLLGQWPCLSDDPLLVPLAMPQCSGASIQGLPQGSRIHSKFLWSNEKYSKRILR